MYEGARPKARPSSSVRRRGRRCRDAPDLPLGLRCEAFHQARMATRRPSLIVGTDDFAFLIPLVNYQGAAGSSIRLRGRREILYRRIGRNELDAIQTCLAYVDAQNEYAEKDRTGDGPGVYARALSPAPARRTDCSGATIPIKPARRARRAGGARRLQGRGGECAVSWLLLSYPPERRGSDAPRRRVELRREGKDDRRVRADRLPAEYGNSGVMTFLVNHAKHRLPEGPRLADRLHRQAHDRVRPRSHLEEGRYVGNP